MQVRVLLYCFSTTIIKFSHKFNYEKSDFKTTFPANICCCRYGSNGSGPGNGEGFVFNFNSVKDRIKGVHMHELHDPAYPYRLFFKLLAESGFKGYCNAEIGRVSSEPVEFMKCYRGLFLALQNAI